MGAERVNPWIFNITKACLQLGFEAFNPDLSQRAHL